MKNNIKCDWLLYRLEKHNVGTAEIARWAAGTGLYTMLDGMGRYCDRQDLREYKQQVSDKLSDRRVD